MPGALASDPTTQRSQVFAGDFEKVLGKIRVDLKEKFSILVKTNGRKLSLIMKTICSILQA